MELRIFKNCLEMIKEVERDLYEMGIPYQSATVQDKDVSRNKDFKTMELGGYVYKISEEQTLEQIQEMTDRMNIPWDWIMGEMKERITPELCNPGKAHNLYPLWEEYLHEGLFQYTYNERIREQLPYILRELKARPNTRQAVITMYDRHQDMRNLGGKARIPCSMHYQFMQRNGKLYLMYVMRSCDFLKHFAADVAFALLLLDHVATETGLEQGHFTHFIGSLHAFHGDLKKRGIF